MKKVLSLIFIFSFFTLVFSCTLYPGTTLSPTVEVEYYSGMMNDGDPGTNPDYQIFKTTINANPTSSSLFNTDQQIKCKYKIDSITAYNVSADLDISVSPLNVDETEILNSMSYIFDLSIYDSSNDTVYGNIIRIMITGSVMLVDEDGETINTYPFCEIIDVDAICIPT